MAWIDTTVVVIIVVAGLVILYRALKEPMDLLFGLIGRGLRGTVDILWGAGEAGGAYYEEIRYG
jgi:hypothetical protein